MKQVYYGVVLLIFLILPPVAKLMESVMIIHMHMQMPMLIIAGILIGKYVQIKFPHFLEKWNQNGVPGILLFLVIWIFWMIPRTMDESLTQLSMEIFKFVSLPFLAGIPLRVSWKKLHSTVKYSIFLFLTLLFLAMGWLYIRAPIQLCNNYLLIEQITLGWGFLTMAICMLVYLIYITFFDLSKYEAGT